MTHQSAPQIAPAMTNRIELFDWAGDPDEDVFEFRDALQFAGGDLETRTQVDLSEQDQEDPVSGQYTFWTDRDNDLWTAETVLDVGTSQGVRLSMFSEFEVDLTPGAQMISSRFHFSLSSARPNIEDISVPNLGFSTGFDFDVM